MSEPDPISKLPLYSIRNWNDLYENNRSRTVDSMTWVKISNRHDGENYTGLITDKNGAILFSAWILIVQVASRCKPRGTLIRTNGSPHTPLSLSLKTRAPQEWFETALDFLERQTDWIDVQYVALERHPTVTQVTPKCASRARAEWNGMEQKGREEKGISTLAPNGDFAEIPSWEEFWSYCQMGHGPAAEFYARDKFNAAAQNNWRDKQNWKAYVSRCRSWWEQDGRPMVPIHRNGVRPEAQLRSLDDEITRHPANRESTHYASNCSDQQRQDLRDIRKKRNDLSSQIARA